MAGAAASSGRNLKGAATLLAAAAAQFLSACATSGTPPPATEAVSAAKAAAAPAASIAPVGPAIGGEPANVGALKLVAVRYHDSGDYLRDFAAATAPIAQWLQQRAPQAARPALVLDIDDTILTNWPVIVANDFGRFPAGPCLIPNGPCGWHAWDLLGRDQPLVPMLEVFRTARVLGIDVFLISGRPENEREATERNLRAAGFGGYTEAFFTPNGAHYTSLVAFKAPTRAKIAARGYTIIANAGDQMSDLDGGYSERTFKLPNPFYYIP